MADYYRIVTNAIESQNLTDKAGRTALYERAKTALNAQFANMDQTLAAELMRSHTQNFDEAVEQIERELGAATAAQSAPDVLPEKADKTDAATVDTAVQTSSSAASAVSEEKPVETEKSTSTESSTAPSDKPPVTTPVDSKTPSAPGVQIPRLHSAKEETPSAPLKPSTPPPGLSAQDAKSAVTASSVSGVRHEPVLQAPQKTISGSPISSPSGPGNTGATPAAPGQMRAIPEDRPSIQRPRGIGTTILAVLFILIAGTSAFSLWQRELVADYADQLGVMTGLWGGNTAMEPEPDSEMQAPSESTDPAPPQEPQQNSNADDQAEPESSISEPEEETSTQSLPPAPGPSSTANSRIGESAPVSSTPSVNTPPQNVEAADATDNDTSAGDNVTEETAQPPAAQTTEAEPSSQEANDQTQVAANESEAQTATPSQPESGTTQSANPIELPLRAFFLIEKAGGGSAPDERYNGGAKWRFDSASGILTIETFYPQRSSELVIEIAANNDASLPATHTVTYQYKNLAETAPDGPVINFPALMIREDAGSQGKPLKGAGALIVPNKYLLGLSNKPEDRAENIDLLKKGQWLVVPAIFEVGNHRALFVIEKGPAGNRAMEAAFAAWGQNQAAN